MNGSLHDPHLLWLAGLLPIAILWRLLRRPAAKAFAPYAFIPHLPYSTRQRTRFLPLALQCCAFTFLVIAMARPQQQERAPITEQGIDLLLCMDLSSSMSATDLGTTDIDPSGRRNASSPTRLDFARRAASAFIAARPHDRIGLLAFARDAHLVSPPTLDHRSIQGLLQDLELTPAGREDDATGIGTALARAAVYLKEAESNSKVVILLTDGEETVASEASSSAIKPIDAAALCRDWGVRVHAIATGPNAVAARASLQSVVAATGGQAFLAPDAMALQQVYAAIDELERTRFERLPWHQVDRFQPVLILAVSLWLLGAWTRRKWWEVQR